MKANNDAHYINIIEQTKKELEYNSEHHYPKTRVMLVPIEKAFSED